MHNLNMKCSLEGVLSAHDSIDVLIVDEFLGRESNREHFDAS